MFSRCGQPTVNLMCNSHTLNALTKTFKDLIGWGGGGGGSGKSGRNIAAKLKYFFGFGEMPFNHFHIINLW